MRIAPCAKCARYAGVGDITGIAPCADGGYRRHRSGSFRAQDAHATPVWGTLPASSRAPMVDMNTIVGRAFGATHRSPVRQRRTLRRCGWVPPCAKCARYGVWVDRPVRQRRTLRRCGWIPPRAQNAHATLRFRCGRGRRLWRGRGRGRRDA